VCCTDWMVWQCAAQTGWSGSVLHRLDGPQSHSNQRSGGTNKPAAPVGYPSRRTVTTSITRHPVPSERHTTPITTHPVDSDISTFSEQNPQFGYRRSPWNCTVCVPPLLQLINVTVGRTDRPTDHYVIRTIKSFRLSAPQSTDYTSPLSDTTERLYTSPLSLHITERLYTSPLSDTTERLYTSPLSLHITKRLYTSPLSLRITETRWRHTDSAVQS